MTEVLFATGLVVALLVLLSALVLLARRALLPSGGIAVVLNDGRRITAEPMGTLLETLLAEGVPLPAACGGKGTCGLCRVKVTGGGGPVLPTEAGRLTDADLRDGLRLACQLRLREDLTAELDPALLNVQTHMARVRQSRALTPTIKEIVFEVPEAWDFRFTAGEFVTVTAPPFSMDLEQVDVAPLTDRPAWMNGLSRANRRVETAQPVTRAYSVANRPSDSGAIVLNIRIALPPPDRRDLPAGLVSSWLFGLAEGDVAALSGPFGSFRAQDNGRPMVLVGGGVGMAPLRALVAEELARGGQDRRVSFYYGARSADDLIYAQDFEALARDHVRFDWVPVVSEDRGVGWTGERGFVHQALCRRHLDSHPTPEDCDYYLCGPPLMIKAVMAALRDAGVPRNCIYFDDFGG